MVKRSQEERSIVDNIKEVTIVEKGQYKLSFYMSKDDYLAVESYGLVEKIPPYKARKLYEMLRDVFEGEINRD